MGATIHSSDDLRGVIPGILGRAEHWDHAVTAA
jgi:hypothetical protein